MGADQNFDWRGLTESALDWWREAGVDVLVGEEPRDWLTLPVPNAAPVEAFMAWRMGPDAPEAAMSGRRLAAEGDPDAPLWVFTDLPEREDLTEGRLLSGAQGRLFDRMLAAIGLTREKVRLVPVCTARPPAGRVPSELEPWLGELSRRHVALGRPLRVLLMGEAASRAVLGMSCRDARGSSHAFNYEAGGAGVETVVVASFHPRLLLDRPMAKADAWRDLRLVGNGL